MNDDGVQEPGAVCHSSSDVPLFIFCSSLLYVLFYVLPLRYVVGENKEAIGTQARILDLHSSVCLVRGALLIRS